MSTDFKCTLEHCKRIEEAEENCDERFRSVFDCVNDALLILDQDGHIRELNRTAHERLGYHKDEVLGMHFSQLNASDHIDSIAEKFTQIRTDGHVIFESVHTCKDGTLFPVEINVRILEINAKPMYLSVVRDLTERNNRERALQMMQASVDHMGDGAFWLTSDARVAYANDAACHTLGYSKEELLNLHAFDFDSEVSPAIWASHWENSRMRGSHTIESTHRTKYGKHIPVEITINHMHYEGEEYHCTFVRDISKRKQEQRALKMMQFAMDNTGDAVFWSTPDGRIAYANIAACRSLGYSLDEMLSLHAFDFYQDISPESWPGVWNKLKDNVSLTWESTHRARDGHVFPVEVSTNYMQFEGEEYICAFVRDITARKQIEEKMSRMAHFDAITNLPNRALLYDRLEQAIALARRQDRQLAVLFLDLDGFKLINDSFGHYVGDDLLSSVAERLRENARDMDSVARVGGDEFIFILNEIGKLENAAIVANKIIESLSLPFLIQGHICHIGGSIGISIFPEDGNNMEDLIKQADDAMYLAKKNGKGSYQFASRQVSNYDLFGKPNHNS